jgi:hypothetical protein
MNKNRIDLKKTVLFVKNMYLRKYPSVINCSQNKNLLRMPFSIQTLENINIWIRIPKNIDRINTMFFSLARIYISKAKINIPNINGNIAGYFKKSIGLKKPL